MKRKIFIALDGSYTLDEFVAISKQIAKISKNNNVLKEKNIDICLKIGLEFFCSFGFYGVNKIEQSELDIFLDLKLFDISNTVCGALKSINKASIGFVKYTTLHLLNGIDCLSKVYEINKEFDSYIKLLGVSVLTSLDDYYLKEQNFKYQTTKDMVVDIIEKSQMFIDGCICSPHEASLVYNLIKNKNNFEIITPGIQTTQLNNDQKRVATPSEAFNNNATGIVIGRAVMKADDKEGAILQIISTL